MVNGLKTIAALFVRENSIYKTLTDVDCWDKKRNAQDWPGGMPCIAHPPCAQWASLAHFARDIPEQKALAPLAVEFVRHHSGILEHPLRSKLFHFMNLPLPGQPPDKYSGWTLCIDQFWWGHQARKRTLLYIVGCAPREIPTMPIVLGHAPAIVSTHPPRWDEKTQKITRVPKYVPNRPTMKPSDNEKTPTAFAHWLVELARLSQNN